jgi:hypothetical protein
MARAAEEWHSEHAVDVPAAQKLARERMRSTATRAPMKMGCPEGLPLRG